MLQQLNNILARLEQQAVALDQHNRINQHQLDEQWFAVHLFSCRSSLAIDYVNEVKKNAQQLALVKRAEVRQFLAEQISQQLLALHTALNGSALPVEAKDQRLLQQQQVAGLQRQLNTYRGYEQRLQLNVQRCRQQHDSVAAQQQEKRLNRCQQAITDLENQIQQLLDKR